MATITLGGETITTSGELPAIGGKAPDFSVIDTQLKEISLSMLRGKRIILNIVPSIDTSVCLASTKTFNSKSNENTIFLTISRDTPFALDRACKSEGIGEAKTASDLSHDFGRDYGCVITSGPLKDLLSRAVVLIDEQGMVRYVEQVPEIKQEPDYQKALEALDSL